jgi:hypothetical protein
MASSSAAQSAKHQRGHWQAVEGLSLGALVEVLPQNQAGPDTCRVASVDDASLTCYAEGSNSGTRLVYPRNAVREVQVWERAPDRHIGRWIAAVVLTGLGVTLIVEGGAWGALIVAAIALGALKAAETPNPWTIMLPPRMPPPKRMHWRLLYRVPDPATP